MRYQKFKYFYSIVPYLAIAVICSLTLRLSWTGFVASDDEYYVAAGLGWLDQFPYVAQHFGTVRASIAIPIAVMIHLFGENELTVALSTAIFFISCAGVTFYILNKLLGCSVAFLASVVLISTPIFALKSTTPNADIPELFFVLMSFLFFWEGCCRKDKIWLLLLSGIFSGLAFSAHELSSALIVFYALLFLKSYKIPRHLYLWMVLGFLMVLLTEGVYYWIMAGNPAHRFNLLLQGVTSSHDRVTVGIFEIASGGTLHIWSPIDPLIMLFTHHNFSILGWLSLPAGWWLIVNQRDIESQELSFARLALGLAVTWLVFNTIMLREIIVLPRYYMVSAYFLFLVCIVWISNNLWKKHKSASIAIFTLVLSLNLLFISIDNKNPKFAEKALVDYLKNYKGDIYTDPLTADDANWYCRWANVDSKRIIARAPVVKSVYFWNPKNTQQPNRLVREDSIALFQPRKSWQELMVIEENPRPIAIIFEFSGVSRFIPDKIWTKILRPNPSVHIYLVND